MRGCRRGRYVLGLDASTAMLGVARRRAAQAGAHAEFRVGDAQALALPDGGMDACRSERMLQWVPDPEAALAEMVRVVRPGGSVVVADTDWRSLMFDLIEPDVHDAVTAAFRAIRGPGYDVGGKLLNRCRDLGLVDVDITAATQVWTHWDPDADDAPTGFFPLRTVMEQLGDHGMIDRVMADRFVVDIEDAARRDRLFLRAHDVRCVRSPTRLNRPRCGLPGRASFSEIPGQGAFAMVGSRTEDLTGGRAMCAEHRLRDGGQTADRASTPRSRATGKPPTANP